jgi:nitrate/TMAO reductase-like tetraheme cytochrome c subunit
MKKLISVLLLIIVSYSALADGNMMPFKVPDTVKNECASCHMVYPPAFLPKASWVRMMGSLDKHYGTDASIDPKDLKEVSQWLVQHAGTYKRVSEAPPNDRITESAWFIKKHRKISQTTWKHAQVKSKSNCMACHTTADKGQYDDDFVKVPK